MTRSSTGDTTWMSESGRVREGTPDGNRPGLQVLSFVARPVHVVVAVLFSGCVIPPPLSIDTSDGGVNAPPAITDLIDTSGTSRRPPATITIEIGALQQLRV